MQHDGDNTDAWNGMTVNYRNTPEDMVSLYEFAIRHSWSYQTARAIGSSISLSFVVYILYLVYRGDRTLDSAFFLLFAASLMASLARDAVKRTVRRSVERMTRASLRPRQLRIDAQGLWFEEYPQPIGWERVRGVISDEFTIMIFFDRSAEVAPTRAFHDPFEAAAFAELARQFLGDRELELPDSIEPAPPTEASEP